MRRYKKFIFEILLLLFISLPILFIILIKKEKIVVSEKYVTVRFVGDIIPHKPIIQSRKKIYLHMFQIIYLKQI